MGSQDSNVFKDLTDIEDLTDMDDNDMDSPDIEGMRDMLEELKMCEDEKAIEPIEPVSQEKNPDTLYMEVEWYNTKAQAIKELAAQVHEVLLMIEQDGHRGEPWRRFGSYQTWTKLSNDFDLTENFHLYEIIQVSKPCKLYFDIDIKRTDHEYNTSQLIQSFKQDIVLFLKQDFALDIKMENILVLDSSNESKISYHLVVDQNNIAFESAHLLKYWVKERFGDRIGVDTAVYTKDRAFRMPFQSKYYCKTHESDWKPTVLVPVDDCKDRDYLDFLITYFAGEPHIVSLDEFAQPFAVVPHSRNQNENRNTNIAPDAWGDDAARKQVVDLVRTKYPDATVTAWTPTSARFANFEDRECLGCNEVHSKNGFYVNLTPKGKQTNARYHCLSNHDPKAKYKDADIGTVEYCMPIRPSDEEDLIREITKPTWELVDHTKLFHIEYGKNSFEYIRDIPFDDKYRQIILHAAMGTGKTTAINRFIEEQKPASVLFVTCRISLADYLHGEFQRGPLPDIKHYQQLSVEEIRKEPYLVCQLESIWKVNKTYDLVIFDESESILSQFVSPTMTGKIRQNDVDLYDRSKFDTIYKRFEHLVVHSKKVIWADAYIKDCTLEIAWLLETKRCNQLRIDGDLLKLPILYIRNHSQPTNRTVTTIAMQKKNAKTQFEEALMNYVRENPTKNLVIHVGSAQLGKDVKARIEENIKTVGDDRKVIHIDRDTGGKTKKMLADPKTLMSANYWIYTTSVTVGVSFNENHFDAMFLYIQNRAAAVRHNIQATNRARKLRDNALYLGVSYANFGGSKAVPNLTRKGLEYRLYRLRELTESQIKDGLVDKQYNYKYPRWLKRIFIHVYQEINVSDKYQQKVVELYLRQSGYTFTTESESPAIQKAVAVANTPASKEERKKKAREETTRAVQSGIMYRDIESICESEYQEFKRQEARGSHGDDVPWKIKKYTFDNMYVDTNCPPETRAKLFDDYYKIRRNSIEERHRKIWDETRGKVKNKHAFVNNGEDNVEQLRIVQEFKQLFGIPHTQQVGFEISREDFTRAGEIFIKQKDRINLHFGIKKPSGDDNRPACRQYIDLANQILTRHGFTKLKQSNNRKNIIIVCNEADPKKNRDTPRGKYGKYAEYYRKHAREDPAVRDLSNEFLK